MNRLQRAARRRIGEGVRIDTLPLRDRLTVYAAHPLRALRYFHIRYRRWATLPGDKWTDFIRDAYFVVTAVKPGHIEAEVYSGQIWKRPDLMAAAESAPRVPIESLWMREYRPGLTVEVLTVQRREMDTWLPA
jgi:hypothetical protein